MMDVYIQEGFWADTWLWKETGIKAWKVSEAAEINQSDETRIVTLH